MPVVYVISKLYVVKNFLAPMLPVVLTYHIYLVLLTGGNKFKGGVYMVFEYMDHDLTGLADRPGLRFTVPQIKVRFLCVSLYLS